MKKPLKEQEEEQKILSEATVEPTGHCGTHGHSGLLLLAMCSRILLLAFISTSSDGGLRVSWRSPRTLASPAQVLGQVSLSKCELSGH